MDEGFGVYCGLDVGKSEHHAAALNTAGERVFNKPLPQDEERLRELFTNLQQHARVLVIVDQPNTIGALPIAVARDCGCMMAYLPGPALRKAANLYPGKSKTDARDAFIIAETARSMPHTLRAVDQDREVLAALKVLSGFEADLTHEPPGRSTACVPCCCRFSQPWNCSSNTPDPPGCAPQAGATCCAGPGTTAGKTR